MWAFKVSNTVEVQTLYEGCGCNSVRLWIKLQDFKTNSILDNGLCKTFLSYTNCFKIASSLKFYLQQNLCCDNGKRTKHSVTTSKVLIDAPLQQMLQDF